MRELPSVDLRGEDAIASRSQDVLGRRSFAEALARALGGWKGDRSLTVGLYGPWGVGKTSILNMAMECLENDFPAARPAVRRFNPWEWSSQAGLFQAFFDEIADALGSLDSSEEGEKRVELWRSYGRRLQSYAARRSTDRDHPGEAQSLQQLKAELVRGMAALPRPMVLVIDDVDRLVPEQMAMLFQLLRANADFPRMVYLVAFQRETIVEALTTRGVNGADYLEKIIQVPFEVPYADPYLVEQELDDAIREILVRYGLEGAFDWKRWEQLYATSLKVFFETLRDVYRYRDAFAFQVALLSGRGAFEVDAADLATLEVLRLFAPEVHSFIGQNKKLFAGADRQISEAVPRREIFEEELAPLGSVRKPALVALLKQLFPAVEAAYGAGSRQLRMQQSFSYPERRVSNIEVFDRYFLLAIPIGDISHSEIEQVARDAFDEPRFREALARHQAAGTLRRLIDRVAYYLQWTGGENDLSCVIPLMEVADRLPSEPGNATSAFRSIHALVSGWYAQVGRFQPDLLAGAVEESQAFVLPTELTARALREASEAQAAAVEAAKEDESLAQIALAPVPEALRVCAGICVQRIEQAAVEGQLQGRPELFELLRAWAEWRGLAPVKAWVARHVVSPGEFMRLLRSFWLVAARPGEQTGWGLVRDLDRLFSPGELLARLEEIDTNRLPHQELVIVQDLLESLAQAPRRAEEAVTAPMEAAPAEGLLGPRDGGTAG
jgi:predicted KAP-like P-loop ATPase